MTSREPADRREPPRRGAPRLLLALAAVAASWAAAPREASAQACFVTRSGGDFSYKQGPFKFIGANVRGLAFHGDGAIDAQLAAARDMGVNVVRIFIAKNNLNATQSGDKLANFLNRMAAVAPNMKALVALTDFYASTFYPDGARLTVQGDDAYYTGGLLSSAWFTGGYTTNYRPFALVITTRFKSDARIFGWELGNELKAGNATDMLNFAYTMGWAIRNTGVQQMVSTGYIGAWHAFNGTISNALLTQLYQGPYSSWPTSPFHYGTIHTYNNEQAPGNPFGYQHQDQDISWFGANGVPYVVGEGGFTGATTSGSCGAAFTGATWDGVSIPSGQFDRGPTVAATLNRYFDAKGADGYLQWGFLVGADNGEGDGCVGMDTHWHTDWTSMWNTYRARANALPAGGASCAGTCTATVPAARWRGEYFANPNLSGAPSLVRDDGDGAININFGTGGPGSCGVGSDNFSVRWTRTVSLAGGSWRFTATADDGVRLYVDGALVIDRWIDQGPTTYTADVALSAGNHTIVLAYYERGGGAQAALSWAPLAQVSTQRLDVRATMSGGLWITQCLPDLGGRYVWQTQSTGKDPYSRWANFMWPEGVTSGCGAPASGLYPLVFTSLPAGSYAGSWVTQCVGSGQRQHVYRIDTTVDAHPAAVFLYDEQNSACP